MTLVSIEEFAGYLKLDLNTLDAYTAQLMLDGAIEAVIEYCGWHIAPVVSELVTVDGSGTALQPLPTLNLLAVDSIEENGRSLDVSQVDWSTNGLVEKRSGGRWTGRRRGVTFGISHGYAAAPRWLVTLICAAAGRAFNTPLGRVQETAGDQSISYLGGRGAVAVPPGTVLLLPFEQKMLDRLAYS